MKALPVILALGGLLFVSGSVEYAKAEEKPAVVVPTPLTKKVGEFYVSIGVFSISDLEKRFPRPTSFWSSITGSHLRRTPTTSLSASGGRRKEGPSTCLIFRSKRR
ncbi:MAG: hypothetical protein Q9N34_00460 [Aquificota bacterium]|nr:hypothetical protein [Aquificota bacterium]